MKDNPYATPQAEDLTVRYAMTAEEAAGLRRRFRAVERLLRSIGLVYFAQAMFVTVVSFFLLTTPEADQARAVSASIYCFILSLILMVAGFGLRKLARWSRLAALVHTLYLLGGFTFGLFAMTVDGRVAFIFAVMHALPFYVLFSSRAIFVLSKRYADAVDLTPDHQPDAWRLALMITVFLAVLIVLDGVLRAPLFAERLVP